MVSCEVLQKLADKIDILTLRTLGHPCLCFPGIWAEKLKKMWNIIICFWIDYLALFLLGTSDIELWTQATQVYEFLDSGSNTGPLKVSI